MIKRRLAWRCMLPCLLLVGCSEMTIREYEPRGGPSAPSERADQKPATVPQSRSKPHPRMDSSEPGPVGGRASGSASPTAGPAVLALLDQAKSEASSGDGNAAAATLERAIAIEPKNPWLWHRLAVLRLQQGQHQQAIELAGKSNALAKVNGRLLGGNWKVIANARRALGDEAGALQAETKSDHYFGQSSTE